MDLSVRLDTAQREVIESVSFLGGVEDLLNGGSLEDALGTGSRKRFEVGKALELLVVLIDLVVLFAEEIFVVGEAELLSGGRLA